MNRTKVLATFMILASMSSTVMAATPGGQPAPVESKPSAPVESSQSTTSGSTQSTQPEATQSPSRPTEPSTTEPSTTEPSTTEPSTTEPRTNEARSTRSHATQPDSVQRPNVAPSDCDEEDQSDESESEVASACEDDFNSDPNSDSNSDSDQEQTKGEHKAGVTPAKTDGADKQTKAEPAHGDRPAEETKGREIRAQVLERFSALVWSEGDAEDAWEKALDQVTAALVTEGQTEDQAEEQVELAVEEKRVSGKASKSELDILAHLQAKKEKVAEAEATMRDRVSLAPDDLAGYKQLGQLRSKMGVDKGVEAYVKGKEVAFDVRPVIKEGRTLVPVRALTEALGAQLSWDPVSRTVTVKAGDKEILLTIDSKTAVVNGTAVELDAAAAILEGRTVLPLRFVAEALGLNVQWEAETQTIVVN